MNTLDLVVPHDAVREPVYVDGEWRDDRAAYERHHGHPPPDATTMGDWVPVLAARASIDLLCDDVLPAVPSDKAAAVLRQLIAFGYRVALRVLPRFEVAAPDETRPRQALDLVRQWLDGEPVGVDAFREAEADCERCSIAYAPSGHVDWAADALMDLVVAAASAATGDVNGVIPALMCLAESAADWAANYDAEMAQQRADLLAALAAPPRGTLEVVPKEQP